MTPAGRASRPHYTLRRGFGWGVNPWVWVIQFKVVQP
jgi:hypothetical protein